ncbi:MAG: response regulator transcription factor [Prolixibacteraceae bacterium]|jgi:two-component system, OmpR family, alkaline phosphatase synthesis response regulator PhoP|nr:response regulator transcription factor [Prolixibacteraceae bacterium]MBT6007286.1 response regulator transcription factor [Prolixibacteraceae bacterium]MBT6765684.1 response regulator transcription factor [Prolixibacteraceae bacterium]MBT6997437.1 response regulator transcription factor [Prolixibacteraceae bacterium]MBT7396648.1 response regulator transcription factor [Prolixibacteraceae bacterium]
MRKLLVVEDDISIRKAIVDDFTFEGYLVESAVEGNEGLEKAFDPDIDIILLDVMLPGIDGFEICKELRKKGIETPIIMLTAKSQEIDKVLGLEFGADDYITKPYSSRELHARVKAVLRRRNSEKNGTVEIQFKIGDLEINFKKFSCKKKEKNIILTTLEFSLLHYLIKKREQVISRNEILDKVWGEDILVSPRTVDTHIAKLRKKIEDDPSNPRWIIGFRGIGYKFTCI